MCNPNLFVEFYKSEQVTKSVNCLGQIKSVNNKINKTSLTFGAKSNGYLVTGVANKKKVSVHRLVARYFCPIGTKDQDQVDHIDGNKTNNNWLNLRWVTSSENSLNPNTLNKISGINHFRYNPTVYNFIHNSGQVFSGTILELNTQFNLKKSLLTNLISGKTKCSQGWQVINN
jgi:hypothetical protein